MSNLIMRFDPSRVRLPYNVEMFMEVEKLGRLVQRLETVVCALAFSYKSEEHVLNPLSGHLDECTRIIEKYIRLNVVYKLVYGCAFLSKLKIVWTRIEATMDSSRLNIASKRELADEFRRVYPQLVYSIFDSFAATKSRLNSSSTADIDSQASTEIDLETLIGAAVASVNSSSQPHFF